MQKLKLYVTETVRERRKLIGLEYIIFRCHLDSCAIATKYLLDIGYRQGTTINGWAEFETTSEREATTDEYISYYANQLKLLGVFEILSNVWVKKQLENKKFCLEVVEE